MSSKISDAIANLYEKDNVLKVVSIISAVIIWAVVSISVYPTMDMTLRGVPVEIVMDNTQAKANGLDVIPGEKQVKTVNVTISGKRGQIGDIKSEDLVARPDVSAVASTGEYPLSLSIECLTGKEFEVRSIDPARVSFSFDRIISKELPVEPQFESVRIASGYLSGDPVVTPETITVTGPQNTVDSITRVCAKVTSDRELSVTTDLHSTEIVMYNENAVISNESQLLTYDKSTFSVRVPVYVRQTLPLEVNIINAPANFNLDYFRKQLVFSVSELDIAAPNDKIKELASLNIGTINMREVDVGTIWEFKAEDFLPADYENLTQIDVVTVTCPSENMAKKSIAVKGKEIQFVNRPSMFSFEPVASGMTLFVVGDEEQIAAISKEDITAQIDLIDFDMQEGDHKMSVDFIISSYDKVWFKGDGGVATPKIYVTAKLMGES